MAKTELGKRGKEHVQTQMERFKNGKLLRTSAGKKLSPEKPGDVSTALAIFYSEAEKGEKRGFAERTYKGSKRMRPRKAD